MRSPEAADRWKCLAALLVVSLVACGARQAVEPSSTIGAAAVSTFTVTSPALTAGGELPALYTCDGESVSPPIAWSGAPAGTASYAVLMDHQPGPGDFKWYWVMYDIDPSITSIAQASTVGTVGVNEHDFLGYEPPCSQGPGAKEYTFHVYALSAAPTFTVATGAVDRAALLEAIEPLTIDSASLSVTYARS
jgi:phosphatidylethanolamine-binding protein (PEBP) family uncharacterized protein